jgi:hypothetical protein
MKTNRSVLKLRLMTKQQSEFIQALAWPEEFLFGYTDKDEYR